MYSKVLQKIVAGANITQEELSNKCKEEGTPISRVQLNKILNGKAKAPDENVSRTIAKICNADDRELVIEGYLEKAPKEFIQFLNIFQDVLMQLGLETIEKQINNEDLEILKEMYRKETLSKVILEMLDMEKTTIPNFDNIAIDKNLNILLENSNYIEMEDDSMQDKIPKGSKLKLKTKEKYKNGDIVLVKVRNDKKLLIRTIFFIGRDICLCALNRRYNSLYLKYGEYQIITGVDSVEIKI